MSPPPGSPLDLSRIIRREALLERLHSIRASIVSLVAPAGFGKSTLVRQFVESEESFAICDCGQIEDELDFARRLLPALADADAERGAALSQRELMLGDGAMSSHERVTLALKAWRAPARPCTFVFEDAERIAQLPAAREFLTRLLAERPEERSIVICSRESLRVHLSRFAPPHRIVMMRGDDLAFTRSEIERIFEPLDLPATTLDRVYEVSQGWPVPVLFIARLAAEGRHEEFLERLGSVAFEELYEYLADQVRDSLSPFLTSALFAAAAIPNASAADLTLATGDPNVVELLAEFERMSPFINCTPEGTYIVHPLMRAMLVEGAVARRRELLESCAARCEERDDFLRAAELHLAKSDPEAAARALERVPVGEDRAPSMRYSRMVASLDRSIVRRYPTLWSCSALLQMFSADSAQLLDETGTLWASLPPDTPVNKRYYVLATRALLLTYLGRFDDALTLLESVAPRSSIPDRPTTREHGYALYLRATIIARQGRIDEADRDLALAWPFIESMDVMASAALNIRGADIARARGDRTEERETLARSLEYARRSQLSNFVAFRLAEVTFGAWLADDRETFIRFGAEFDELVESDGIRGFRFFAQCVRGRMHAEPASVDFTRFVIYGYLVLACSTKDNELAARYAHAAAERLVHYPTPLLQTIAAVVAAELGSHEERARSYAEAAHYASTLSSKPLASAVEAARSSTGDAGMLEPLLARLRFRRNERSQRLTVALLEGVVRRGAQTIRLPARELELLFALARRRQIVSTEELAGMLWPDRDDESTRNGLKVRLHRLRQHLGDDSAILRSREGLRLADDVEVDLWTIERAIAQRRSRDIEDDADRDAVVNLYEQLRRGRASSFHAWEWFQTTERTIRELSCELARKLAEYALTRNRIEEALQIANEMIAHDECDESAREIAIAGYIAQGDRAAALRVYRQYREILLAELQCEPSPSLTALIQLRGRDRVEEIV